MEKRIAFYISEGGMEHALRNIPILKTMDKLEGDLTLYLKSGQRQLEWMKEELGERDSLRYMSLDMREQEPEMWDDLIEAEIAFLQEEQIGLVVTDVCPWILLAADELRIKSILIGHQIREEDDYLECYEAASEMLLYDLHTSAMPALGVPYEPVSLVSLPYEMEKIEGWKAAYGGRLVFVDVAAGEKKMSLDVGSLPYYFLTVEGTDRLLLTGENVTRLPADTRYLHNEIAAASYVIADAGWERMAEILLANKKAALLEQKNDPGSRERLELLLERQQCIEIQEMELEDISGILERLREFSYSLEQEYHNDDYEIAKKILFAYPAKRRRNRS